MNREVTMGHGGWLNPLRCSLSAAAGGAYSNDITLGIVPDLQICPNAACATLIADAVVAVVFSLAADTNASADQVENTDGDIRFVLRGPGAAAGSQFDDELRWISANGLTYQLVRAGQLNRAVPGNFDIPGGSLSRDRLP